MERSNHILIIYLGSRGGGVIDTYEICESFCKVGKNTYSLIVSEDNSFKERYKSLPLRELFVVKTHKPLLGDFLLHSVSLVRIVNITKIVKKLNPSAVLFTMIHPWTIPLVLYLKAFMPKTLVVYLRHNPEGFESISSKILNFISNKIDRFLVYKSDYLFTLSQFVKEVLLKSFKIIPTKVYSFNLGAHYSICTNWNHSGFYKDGNLRLLFFGRILDYKGIDVMADAFEIMRNKKLPVELTIAGEGDIEKNILAKIKKLGITLLNYWISNNELCKLLSNVDVIVIPYKKASQSGPASIAIAMGIPVIATKVGGLPEQIYDNVNGFLVSPNNPEEIVEKVEKFLADPSLLDRFSEGAKYLRENLLSWDNIVLNMDKVFTRLLGGRKI